MGYGLVVLLGVLLASCRVNVKPIDGNGTIVEKEIAIADYHVVSAVGNELQIQYEQSAETPRLKLECDENLLPLLTIYVANDSLVIEPKREGLLMKPTHLVVKTNSADLSRINLAGDVSFEAKDSLVVSDLALSMAGKCKVHAQALDAQRLELNIAGKCQTDFQGKAKLVDLSLAGQCDYEALALQTEELVCKTAGKCSLHVFVTDKIDVSLAGACHLYYKGDPQIVQQGVAIGTVEKIQ